VVADQTGRGLAAGTTRVRLRWLAIVVSIMALLTAGWPLLNFAVANRQPLAAGAKVTVGSGRASSGTVTVGPGWSVQPAESNPALQDILRRGAVLLLIRHVSLVNRRQIGRVWPGMRLVLAVTNPGSMLSGPVTITTAHGLTAFTGNISGLLYTGTATVVPGPTGNFAVAMVALAPRGTSPALLAAARQVMTSVMFSTVSR
jgi:hypothetical protein